MVVGSPRAEQPDVWRGHRWSLLPSWGRQWANHASMTSCQRASTSSASLATAMACQKGKSRGSSSRSWRPTSPEGSLPSSPSWEPPLRSGLLTGTPFLFSLTRLSVLAMRLCSLQFMMVVGFLLVMVLAFTYPQSTAQLGLVNLGSYNWSSPLSHVRLLSLPIAKKYNLQGLEHLVPTNTNMHV